MTREFLLNADFDLSLRPGWRQPASAKHARQVTELGAHALFAAQAGDSVILDHGVPASFAQYLGDRGLELPEVSISPAIREQARFTPFGWNEAAAGLNRRYASPSEHPAVEVVRRVNGRDYAAELATDRAEEEYHQGAFSSLPDLERALAAQPERNGGWVVKANHGNAAMGNRRLPSRTLGDGERAWVAERLAEEQLVVLEPWCSRLVDLGVVFTVGREGAVHQLSLHESVNTAAGAFIGVIFAAASSVIAPWRDRLVDAAEAVAGRLHADGYFGPVSLDAFVWSDGGAPRLRTVVDLNARLSISAGAERLWHRLDQEAVAYWRFYTRRKLSLPDDYQGVVEAMGDDALDGHSPYGTLLASPLSLEGGAGRIRPHKLGVLFLGRNRDEVVALDGRFRSRFAARPGL